MNPELFCSLLQAKEGFKTAHFTLPLAKVKGKTPLSNVLLTILAHAFTRDHCQHTSAHTQPHSQVLRGGVVSNALPTGCAGQAHLQAKEGFL